MVASNQTAELMAKRRAAGGDTITLYGSPWWLPPEHVLAAATDAVGSPDTVPAAGSPKLIEAAAKRLQNENGVLVDPVEGVVITNAANHGLYAALTVLIDPGDEVLTFSPHYYYQGIVHLAGGVSTYASTHQSDGWAWDVEALRAAVTQKTRVLIVNTPGNPTGYVASRADLEAIAELAAERDLVIISDEAYDHTVYDGLEHLSIAAIPTARDRTLTAVSFTKSYAMRQWRIGFVAGPAELISHCRNVVEWNVFSCNHVAQRAALAALQDPHEWIDHITRVFSDCRDLMLRGLEDVPGIDFVRPHGSPFLFLRVHGLSVSAARFRELLISDQGIPTDPGQFFGSRDHVRLMCGGPPDDVREAAARIQALAASLTGDA